MAQHYSDPKRAAERQITAVKDMYEARILAAMNHWRDTLQEVGYQTTEASDMHDDC